MSRRRKMKYPKARPGAKVTDQYVRGLLAEKPRPGFWRLRFDGSVFGNGRADATGRWAFELEDGSGKLLVGSSGKATGDPVTVNTCEFEGLMGGLRAVAACLDSWRRAGQDCPGLLIEGDSDLVICQVNGRWAARGPLKTLRDGCWELLAECGVPWFARHIPREMNARCDARAKSFDGRTFTAGLSAGLVA